MKALVLSSGGVDSTTCLAMAIDSLGHENVSALSIWYGQKHKKELDSAKAIADYYKVPHYELDLTQVMSYSNSSLLSSSSKSIDHRSYGEQIAESGSVSTYVPFRNGLILSMAASMALSLYPDDEVAIYIGAHADDATGNAYPDCRPDFNHHMNEAIYIGSYNKVHLVAPLNTMNKTEVVQEGLRLQVPYHLTWSCYEGGHEPCHTCGTCRDREQAFLANGVEDPLLHGASSN
ncbi:7-cyano-7-deazaguanine synthase QueC [Veillonella sp. CHU110]|uniref:7-cyano-7-deazaguanine synthase QueC n=1 Tax=Veillonella sp. CHU110 TaxID=2490947 RepID=UPI000F8D48DC|nr:7-cyano-7-deazaguanine synthase QueC [Veillonella sp. CHU110]